MLSNILYILLAIVILGVIIVFHEFGHFIVGRLCGIGVVEFSVGFGPKILGRKRKRSELQDHGRVLRSLQKSIEKKQRKKLRKRRKKKGGPD